MPDPMPAPTDSCATCRHHRKEARAQIEQEVFGSIVAFADQDIQVFMCGIDQKEVGATPIFCASFEPSSSKPLSELDELCLRAAKRLARRGAIADGSLDPKLLKEDV